MLGSDQMYFPFKTLSIFKGDEFLRSFVQWGTKTRNLQRCFGSGPSTVEDCRHSTPVGGPSKSQRDQGNPTGFFDGGFIFLSKIR